MSKHTPGPWLAERDGSDNWNVVSPAFTGFDYFVVGTEGLYRGDGSDEANARLIAAAPELLAALESLRDGVLNIRGVDVDAYCPDEFAAARAAISKATGEGA